MYDKKQALGFILIIMVVMTYTQFVFAPYQTPPQSPSNTATANPASSNQAVNQNVSTLPGQSNQNNPQLQNNIQAQSNPLLANPANSAIRIPTLSEIDSAPKTIIQTGVSTITITHLGARIKSLELNNIKKELNGQELYNLISPLEGTSLPAGLQIGAISDEGLKYEVKEVRGFEQKDPQTLAVPNATTASLTMIATAPAGQTFTKTFQFKSNSYLFNIDASVSPYENQRDLLTLYWPINVDKEALHQRFDPYFFSILSENNKVSHIPAVNDLASYSKSQPADWLAFGDRYFMTSLLPTNRQQSIRIDSHPGTFVLAAESDKSTIQIGVFTGPKIYQLLKSQGLQLERSIDLGFFAIVAYPLLQLLKFLFAILGNYGVAIVALTLIVKTLFYPLNKASLKSMRAMQELSPEIAALRERVKDSAQLNQEMLALYKRKGVNPMGGCLPVLIQIPVFFGLYTALQNAVELRHAPYALWVKDLASPEKLHFLGINFPIMVLTMGAIMFIQQYRTPMPNMDASQRKIMLGMSLVFTFMFLIFPFPAGLALYMLVNTTISLVQQQCIKSETVNKPFQATLIASAAILAFSFIFSKL